MARTPTLEEVRDYAGRRHSVVDPDDFWARYQRSGWMIGGRPIQNWRKIFNAWEAKEMKPATEPEPATAQLSDADPEDIAALIADIKRLQAINQKQIDDYRPELLRKAGLMNLEEQSMN